MKHTIILVCILMLINTISFAQNVIVLDTNALYWHYYQFVILAEKEQLDSNFSKADIFYSKAFNSVNNRGFNVDFIAAAQNSLKVYPEKRLFYLGLAIENGLEYRYLVKNKSINRSLTKLELKSLKKKSESIDLKQDKLLKKKVRRMVFRDQHRARAFWTDWLKWEKQCKIMDKFDTPNAKELLQICRIAGWPGFMKIGENTTAKNEVNDLSLLIQHFSKEYIDSLLPYMKDAVENGQMYPNQLARTIDYHYMITVVDSADWKIYTRQTIYGTFTDGKTIVPFGSLDSVNEKRKNIGLENIEQYARFNHLKIPNYSMDFMRVKNNIDK